MASEESAKQNYGLQRRWQGRASAGFDLHTGVVGCTSSTMLREQYAKFFADSLSRCLDRPRRQPVCFAERNLDKLIQQAR